MNGAKLESLDELVEGIDMGLDVVFLLHGVWYNISTDGTPFIAVCPDGDGDYYKDGSTLVAEHKIDGVPLKDQWANMEIYAM